METINQFTECCQASICVVAIAKDEEPFLDEWLVYHKLLGVDHFILYDDHPSLPLRHFLQPHSSYTTVVDWQADNENTERQGNQVKAYTDACQKYINKYEWVIFLDIDEYIVLRQHAHLQEFLKEFKNASAISLSWHLFGHNGFFNDPERLITSSLTRRMQQPSHEGKTITRTRDINGMVSPHFCELKKGNRVDANNRLYSDEVYEGKTAIAHINHYLCRSYTRWMKRVDRGNVNYNPACSPPEHRWRFDTKLCLERFVNYISRDKNEYVDDHMLTFRYAIQEKLGRLNRNNNFPYNSIDENLKTTIREQLDIIAGIIKANLDKIDNIGLLDGKTGIAIFLFHYSMFLSDPAYQETANKLLEDIAEEISSGSPLNYEEGLAGYGFAIEYCVKQGFIKVDTNDLLEDIDLLLYYFLIKEEFKSAALRDGLTGIGRYFISRLKNPFNDPYNESEDRNSKTLDLISDSIYVQGLSFDALLDVISFLTDAFDYFTDKIKILNFINAAICEFGLLIDKILNTNKSDVDFVHASLILIEASKNLYDERNCDLAAVVIKKLQNASSVSVKTDNIQNQVNKVQLQHKLNNKKLCAQELLNLKKTIELSFISGAPVTNDLSLDGLAGLGLNLLGILDQDCFPYDLFKSNY